METIDYGEVDEIDERDLPRALPEVITQVQQGRKYTVSRGGEPIAQIVQLVGDADLRCDRPAKKRRTYSHWPRIVVQQPTREVLRDSREGR